MYLVNNVLENQNWAVPLLVFSYCKKYLGDELLQQLLHRHRGLLQRHELAPHSLATLRILE